MSEIHHRTSSYFKIILKNNSNNFQARHIYICDFHKGRIQCARTKRRRKDSEDDSNETDTDIPEVDLYQLQVNTLRRYKRFYKVSTRPGMNKAQLADVSTILSSLNLSSNKKYSSIFLPTDNYETLQNNTN